MVVLGDKSMYFSRTENDQSYTKKYNRIFVLSYNNIYYFEI